MVNFLFFYLEAMYPTGNVSCGKLDLSMGYADNLYRSSDFFFFLRGNLQGLRAESD